MPGFIRSLLADDRDDKDRKEQERKARSFDRAFRLFRQTTAMRAITSTIAPNPRAASS